MVVQFEPTGENQSTAFGLFQVGPVAGPYTIPVIGNGGFGGPLTSGNLGYQIGGTGAAYLVWKDKEELLAQWAMDDATAVTTGISNLLAAIAADETAVVLQSDGVVYVAS